MAKLPELMFLLPFPLIGTVCRIERRGTGVQQVEVHRIGNVRRLGACIGEVDCSPQRFMPDGGVPLLGTLNHSSVPIYAA